MDTRKFKAPTSRGTTIQNTQTPETKKDIDTPHLVGAPIAAEMDASKPEVIEGYLSYLEENDITKEDIFAVLDSIVTTGNVYWSFMLFDKIEVTFRIRPAWINAMLIKELDIKKPKTFARFSDLVGMNNLIGSLTKYDKTTFTVESEDDVPKITEFILNLPFIVQNHLIKKMAIFDRVVAVATSDWAIKNFTLPQSEK